MQWESWDVWYIKCILILNKLYVYICVKLHILTWLWCSYGWMRVLLKLLYLSHLIMPLQSLIHVSHCKSCTFCWMFRCKFLHLEWATKPFLWTLMGTFIDNSSFSIQVSFKSFATPLRHNIYDFFSQWIPHILEIYSLINKNSCNQDTSQSL